MPVVEQNVAPNPLARALAALPEVWQSLLVEHEADEHGRCRSCRSAGRPGLAYPCTLRVAAEDARDLSAVIPTPR